MVSVNRKESDAFLAQVFGELLYYIERIEKYSDMEPDAFASDEIVQDALMLQMQNVGNALKQITGREGKPGPFGLEELYPELPWRKLKGMRDIIAHNYIKISILYPWDAAKEQIPLLKEIITNAMASNPEMATAVETSLNACRYVRKKDCQDFIDSFDDNIEENASMPKL